MHCTQTEELAAEKYNCTSPWINDTRYEICPIVDENRYKSFSKVMQKLMTHSFTINCPKEPYCKRSEYKMQEAILSGDKLWPHSPNGSTLKILLESPDVQSIVDHYSYGLQNFVGEAGGALGLFLGISMLSVVDFIGYILRKICTKYY